MKFAGEARKVNRRPDPKSGRPLKRAARFLLCPALPSDASDMFRWRDAKDCLTAGSILKDL
jgi:hypothetical protein